MKLSALSLLLLCSILTLMACNTGEQKSSPATTETATTDATHDAPPAQEGQLSRKTFRGLEVRPINYPGQTFMGIREKVSMDQIQSFYGKTLGKVFTACQAYGLEMAGMPSGLFYEFNEEARYIDMAATVAVKSGKEIGDGIQKIDLPASKALQIDFYGPYQKISEAHYAMDDYMSTYKVTQNRAIPVIEEYVTDPGAEPNPNKRLTRVIYFYQ